MSSRRTSRYRTQKSPDWRFLFVLRLLIFFVYLAFGVFVILWDMLPVSQVYDLNMAPRYRYALGALLIIYAFIRFIRLMPKKNETEE